MYVYVCTDVYLRTKQSIYYFNCIVTIILVKREEMWVFCCCF